MSKTMEQSFPIDCLNMVTNNSSRRFPIFLLAILFLAGCGGGESDLDRAEVAGRIMVNGEPLEEGIIEFLPTGETPGPSVGGVIQQGEYSIPLEKGPAVGAHHVKIEAMRKTGRQVMGGAPGEESLIDERKSFIPAKYNTQTTLIADIQPDSNRADFNLQIED